MLADTRTGNGAGYSIARCGAIAVDTVKLPVGLGVQRPRKTVHDWVQKVNLKPESGRCPNQVVLDKMVIRCNDQHFWLYTVGSLQTNELLHVLLFETVKTALSEIFLRELLQKPDVESVVFLVEGAQYLQTSLQRDGLRFQICRE